MRPQAAALKALLDEPRLQVMPGCGDGMGARCVTVRRIGGALYDLEPPPIDQPGHCPLHLPRDRPRRREPVPSSGSDMRNDSPRLGIARLHSFTPQKRSKFLRQHAEEMGSRVRHW